MKFIRLLIHFLAISSLIAGLLQGQQAGYNLVVHKDNPVSSLSKKEVSNLFLKKVSKWSNGESVQPLDLVETSPVREKFSREIHGRKVSSIKAYWQKQIFSGRKIPPPEKKSDLDVIAFVQDNAGAIGYVSSRVNLSSRGVKIIQVKN
jgi:ABC-type phosphate transport system substrate-binding protein